MDVTMLKGILFDLGSTLIEFDNTDWGKLEQECLRNAYQLLSQDYRVPQWEQFAEEFLGRFHQDWLEADQTLREIRLADWVSHYLQENHVISQDGIGREFINLYYQPIARQISLIESAGEVLSHFKQEGLRIGLVSNSSFPSEFHLRELEEFGLKNYFDYVIFSHDYGFRKPHPGLFCEGLNNLCLSPEEVIFVGDRLREDVAGAQSVGMKAILKFKPGRDYSFRAVPDAVIHHLNELPKLVHQLS